MKDHKGKIICDSSVIEDEKQKRIQIPIVIEELLNIKRGDKFRWYVKRNKHGWLKIYAIYLGDVSNASYKYPKKQEVQNEESIDRE